MVMTGWLGMVQMALSQTHFAVDLMGFNQQQWEDNEDIMPYLGIESDLPSGHVTLCPIEHHQYQLEMCHFSYLAMLHGYNG